jgi:prophage antirepressor-like protein
MRKLTKKEIDKREAQLRAEARKEIAKREIFHFRIDSESIEKLYEVAGKKRKPVGTMVREWVMERLDHECVPRAGKRSSKSASISYEQLLPTLEEIRDKMAVFEALANKYEARKIKKSK